MHGIGIGLRKDIALRRFIGSWRYTARHDDSANGVLIANEGKLDNVTALVSVAVGRAKATFLIRAIKALHRNHFRDAAAPSYPRDVDEEIY